MEKAKIRPLATPKPLNRSSQKLAGVITSWTAPGIQNFIAIDWGVSVPQIRDFAVLLGWLVCSFFGFFNKATAYRLHPWTDIYAKYVKWRRSASAFWGSRWLYFIFGPLYFPKTAISGTDFDWTVFLRPKTFILATFPCGNIPVFSWIDICSQYSLSCRVSLVFCCFKSFWMQFVGVIV